MNATMDKGSPKSTQSPARSSELFESKWCFASEAGVAASEMGNATQANLVSRLEARQERQGEDDMRPGVLSASVTVGAAVKMRIYRVDEHNMQRAHSQVVRARVGLSPIVGGEGSIPDRR
jgi:hypothetical protein